MKIPKKKLKFKEGSPSGVQPKRRGAPESIEVSNAEAVAVWYGIKDSTQQLNSTGDLITHKITKHTQKKENQSN